MLTGVDEWGVLSKTYIVARGSTACAVPRASSTRKAKTRTMRAVAIAATHVISVEENARRILILAAFAFLALC